MSIRLFERWLWYDLAREVVNLGMFRQPIGRALDARFDQILEEAARVRRRLGCDLLRGAGSDDLTALVAALRPEINDPVG